MSISPPASASKDSPAPVEMQKEYSEEEELMSRATEAILYLADQLRTRTNELSELRHNNAEITAFANRITAQLIGTVMSRDERIRELKQKYEDTCAFTKYLESEEDRIRHYYAREMGKLKCTIVQLECEMECRQKKFKQQVEEKQEQLTKEKEACRNLMDQMEKLKESMETEKLEWSQNSSKEIEALREELEEKEEALQSAEYLNGALIVKEFASNRELQDARKELINGLQEVASHHHHWSTIGIKRMGDINYKAFHEACLHRFAGESVADSSAKLCSLWQQHLQDPHWHPFKINQCIEGQQQEVIDEDDEKLKQLRNEYGEAVYESVTKALLELNEYNPSGRYPVLEVWNFREGRRAMMKEVIQYLITQLKTQKRKRR